MGKFSLLNDYFAKMQTFLSISSVVSYYHFLVSLFNMQCTAVQMSFKEVPVRLLVIKL